jgi:low affinity Fe/Cu permease
MKKSLKNFWIALIVVSLSITISLAILEKLIGFRDMFTVLLILAVASALIVFIQNTRQDYNHYKHSKYKKQ